jgi:hypothetical protein
MVYGYLTLDESPEAAKRLLNHEIVGTQNQHNDH